MVHCKCRKSMITVALVIIFSCAMYGCNGPERPLDFPFDHGPHFNSIFEWWYFTGEALTMEGRTLGFQFTIFKIWPYGLSGFIYIGHVAISDPEASEHFFDEVATFSPVSGIEEGKTEIEIKNFSYVFSESDGFTLKAETDSLLVDLSLSPTMDVLTHGEEGIVVMGDGINAYYYSLTNLSTQGSISVNGFEYTVSSGRTWMDHQWGNYTIFGMAWDWFSLRLDDGGALMLFQFRDASDNVVRSSWTYRSSSGSLLSGEDFSIQAARTYVDTIERSVYPIDWVVDVPEIDAMFLVKPLFDAQCLYNVLTPDYWEGLCAVEGTVNGEAVNGSAFVELTGY